MELLSKLGIDWKILIAQVINFAILLFLLAKFVYKPALTMMEKRRKLIEKGVKDAEDSAKRLKEIDELREQKLTEAHREIGKLLDSARKDAEGLKKEIVAAAQTQSEELVKRARSQMVEEKDRMMEDLKREVTGIIVQATGRILQREFSGDDQKRLLQALSKEMESMKK